MTSAPAGQKKAASENTDPVVNATLSPFEELAPATPEEPVAPVVVEQLRTPRKASKADPLADVDLSKLPVASTVGQMAVTLEEYAGRAVLSLSLVGWVGDAPLKILATDVSELEEALANLREQLS